MSTRGFNSIQLHHATISSRDSAIGTGKIAPFLTRAAFLERIATSHTLSTRCNSHARRGRHNPQERSSGHHRCPGPQRRCMSSLRHLARNLHAGGNGECRGQQPDDTDDERDQCDREQESRPGRRGRPSPKAKQSGVTASRKGQQAQAQCPTAIRLPDRSSWP